LARDNIRVAQERQKELYDRKHAHPCAFTVGDKVLMKDITRKKRKGGKMDVKFLGPYTITKKFGKGIYSFVSDENVVEKVSRAYLKPYMECKNDQPLEEFDTGNIDEEFIFQCTHESLRQESEEHKDSIPPLPPPISISDYHKNNSDSGPLVITDTPSVSSQQTTLGHVSIYLYSNTTLYMYYFRTIPFWYCLLRFVVQIISIHHVFLQH
jgi:hypothetical protein